MVMSIAQRQGLFPEPDPALEASAAIAASLIRLEGMIARLTVLANRLEAGVENVECEIV